MLRAYLDGFFAGSPRVEFMGSDGGLLGLRQLFRAQVHPLRARGSLRARCPHTGEDGGAARGEEGFEAAIKLAYKEEFEFLLEDKWAAVGDIKVRGNGKTFDGLGPSVFAKFDDARRRVPGTSMFYLEKLDVGDEVRGPAMIIDNTDYCDCTRGDNSDDEQISLYCFAVASVTGTEKVLEVLLELRREEKEKDVTKN
ncbi:hypothetical protein FIBSPDRAFT_957999 [Athelia psychrophila]|uniref:Uncharacterized protein n=1 Tax=Athelia psychrophila TaxID=1759441 RepID=A0A166F4T7_9AGAM|nr:hypothetical protein FIBSPDRAFT_957999 [Fibularhizoctonia sp. CBS 109695]